VTTEVRVGGVLRWRGKWMSFMNRKRSELLDRVARAIVAIPHRPALVAVEGRSAAGKTTFANELVTAPRRT